MPVEANFRFLSLVASSAGTRDRADRSSEKPSVFLDWHVAEVYKRFCP